MKINTFTAVAGTPACDAKCPYCISKMTPKKAGLTKIKEINIRNFHIAAKLAEKSGASTMLITGKGEPMLSYPSVLTYCELGRQYFPVILRSFMKRDW